MMPKCVVAGLILLLFQFTGCGARCSSSYVNLQAADGVVRNLTSPNYPQNYENNENCKWRIRAPGDTYVVHLHVLDLSIERASQCSYDSLSIYDTDYSSRLAILCGDLNTTRHFYSRGQSMDVIFKSDRSVTRKGFKLQYSALRSWNVPMTTTPRPSTTPTPSTSPRTHWGSCPFGFVHLIARDYMTKFLTSPNYPSNYGNNENCRWRIRSPSTAYVVHLYVLDLHLESSDGCEYDSLSIYDTDNSSRLAILCGGLNKSRHFYSSGQSMNVIFKSDHSVTSKGFKLQYSAVRSWNVPSTSTFRPYGYSCPDGYADLHAEKRGTSFLTSPNYPSNYGNNEDCRWRIRSPGAAYVVHLHVLDLHLENSDGCEYDSLSIYDTDQTRLAILCGDGHDSQHFYSSGRSMEVIFKSDMSSTFRGFKLEFSAHRSRDVPDTDSGRSSRSVEFKYVPLVAGLVSTFVLFVIIGIVLRVSARNSQTTSGCPAVRSATTSRTNAGYSGNGVYVVPITQQQQRVTGYTNLAFSQELPAYSSLHGPDPNLASASPPLPPHANGAEMVAPPTYTQGMRMTHPPAGSKIEERDDAAQHTQSEVTTGPPPPPPPLTPATPLNDPQESAMVVDSDPPAAEASGVAEAAMGEDGGAVGGGPVGGDSETQLLW